MLQSCAKVQDVGASAIHTLSHHAQGLEFSRGNNVYKVNDASDGFYIIVDGRVTLYDIRDKDDPGEDEGIVVRLGPSGAFGEEDLLSGSRRAHRAEAVDNVLLLRVAPELYRKHLQPLHRPSFEDKVDFLGRLEVFRSLSEDTVRKLAPCFSSEELRAKEYLVKQGERADSMYAIASGQCSVLVDPKYQQQMQASMVELDPKKLTQVCLIGPGNIIGDMTVLANVRKRTASVLTITDVVVYRIRRATFIRRVPPLQLEALRQVAEAKLRVTEKHVSSQRGHSAGAATSLRDKVLHGHDLRRLGNLNGGPAPGAGGLPLSGPSASPLSLHTLAATVAGGTSGMVGAPVTPDAAELEQQAAAAAAAAGAAAARPETPGQGAAGTLRSVDLEQRLPGAFAGVSDGVPAGPGPLARPPSPGRLVRPSTVQSSTRFASLPQAWSGASQSGIGSSALPGQQRPREPSASAVMQRVPLHRAAPQRDYINYSWGLGPGTLMPHLMDNNGSTGSAQQQQGSSSPPAATGAAPAVSTAATAPTPAFLPSTPSATFDRQRRANSQAALLSSPPRVPVPTGGGTRSFVSGPALSSLPVSGGSPVRASSAGRFVLRSNEVALSRPCSVAQPLAQQAGGLGAAAPRERLSSSGVTASALSPRLSSSAGSFNSAAPSHAASSSLDGGTSGANRISEPSGARRGSTAVLDALRAGAAPLMFGPAVVEAALDDQAAGSGSSSRGNGSRRLYYMNSSVDAIVADAVLKQLQAELEAEQAAAGQEGDEAAGQPAPDGEAAGQREQGQPGEAGAGGASFEGYEGHQSGTGTGAVVCVSAHEEEATSSPWDHAPVPAASGSMQGPVVATGTGEGRAGAQDPGPVSSSSGEGAGCDASRPQTRAGIGIGAPPSRAPSHGSGPSLSLQTLQLVPPPTSPGGGPSPGPRGSMSWGNGRSSSGALRPYPFVGPYLSGQLASPGSPGSRPGTQQQQRPSGGTLGLGSESVPFVASSFTAANRRASNIVAPEGALQVTQVAPAQQPASPQHQQSMKQRAAAAGGSSPGAMQALSAATAQLVVRSSSPSRGTLRKGGALYRPALVPKLPVEY